MYLGEFKEGQLEAVKSYFEIEASALEGCKILFAGYSHESYEGYALVIFYKDGKLFEVNGSHCSCMGLEGQWKPEETSIEALQLRKYDHGGLQQDLSAYLVDAVFEEDVLS